MKLPVVLILAVVAPVAWGPMVGLVGDGGPPVSEGGVVSAPRSASGEAPAQEPPTPFDLMMDVLTHPRCVNCHPAGDQPRVADGSLAHGYGVQRGADNHGAPALRCSTCHQEANNRDSGVPGAPEWSLAPPSMRWEGLSREDIARSMLDPGPKRWTNASSGCGTPHAPRAGLMGMGAGRPAGRYSPGSSTRAGGDIHRGRAGLG